MAFFKKKTQNQEQGEKILKQKVGTKGRKNSALYQKIAKETGYLKAHKIMDNTIDEVKKELEQNRITADEVEDRIDALIEYELGYSLDDSSPTNNMKTDFIIKIPYTSSGVKGYTNIGGALIGSNIGEGITKWRTTTLFVRDYGVEVKSTGQQIRFSDIVDVQTGDSKGMLIKTVNLALFLRNNEQFVMGVMTEDVDYLTDLFRANMVDDVLEDSGSTGSNVDELMKYADLFERGLLSQEEFEEVKKRLL